MTRLNEQQIEIMKDELAVELADWLMESYGYTAAEALDILILLRLLTAFKIRQQVSTTKVWVM